jgi:hypothetical protein
VNEIDKIKAQVARDTQNEINAGREMNSKPSFRGYDETITEVEGIKPEDVPGLKK